MRQEKTAAEHGLRVAESMSMELPLHYLQLDNARRAPLFNDFCAAVRRIAKEGKPDVAAELASRAVTHKLDYSSLQKLGKLIKHASDCRPELRIAVLGGPTIIQLAALLRLFLSANAVEAAVWCGEYRQFRMEVLGPSAQLDEFAPDLLVFALDARDALVPFSSAWSRDEMLAAAEREAEGLANLWLAAAKRWGCGIVQNLLDSEPFPVLGNYSFAHGVSREAYAHAINASLRHLSPKHAVYFHDLPSQIKELGALRWYDPRYYNDAKLPCAPEYLPAYAHSLASVITAIRGKNRKMLVLDLDNTLWGGMVGEAGPWDIEIGQGSGQGEAFLRFQCFIKELVESGVVLGICSKNDHANAIRPFEENSNMVLRLDDIASFKANWRNKDENIREMAAEVNLGLDALVFVDDNPVERALVRRMLAQVAVPDMPEDPSLFIAALAEGRYFEKIALTSDDLARSMRYAANRRRCEMSETADSIDSFLASLAMVAAFEPIGEGNIGRAVQLINKSNQFNLTGVKRDRGEIQQILNDRGWRTLTVNLKDNCGDNGLVSVLLLRTGSDTLVVESWVISCRVLQRGLENRIVKQLVSIAREEGCSHIEGRYNATAKNGMVDKLYERLGFERVGEKDGFTVWRTLSASSRLAIESHIA